MKITAIILTYNRPQALELILVSILRQKTMPDEVIIADDGSGQETLNSILKFKKILPLPLKHVWHEDKGFRIASIRNKAIKESTGDCLIFSDGDLLFHPNFFNDFKRNLHPGNALIGSRVFLSQNYSCKLPEISNFKGTISFVSGNIEKNRLNSVRLPFLSNLIPYSTFSHKLRGGLLAVWKQDIVAVNGWNEDFTGWGKEDTELLARLYSYGIKFKKLKFAGITYHLWHPFESRSYVQSNEKLLTRSISQQLKWCNNGLNKKNS
jgi:glycosyltransferase involved in cell wall biosynthesis